MRHTCLGTSTLPMRSVGGVLMTQNATMDFNLNAKEEKKPQPHTADVLKHLKDEGAEDHVQIGSGRIGPPLLRSPLGPSVLFSPYR